MGSLITIFIKLRVISQSLRTSRKYIFNGVKDNAKLVTLSHCFVAVQRNNSNRYSNADPILCIFYQHAQKSIIRLCAHTVFFLKNFMLFMADSKCVWGGYRTCNNFLSKLK